MVHNTQIDEGTVKGALQFIEALIKGGLISQIPKWFVFAKRRMSINFSSKKISILRLCFLVSTSNDHRLSLRKKREMHPE
jgi:hypothetical protein